LNDVLVNGGLPFIPHKLKPMSSMSRSSRKGIVPFTFRNNVELVKGGREYFDVILRLIRAAKDTIHLQVYIFDDDNTGRMVAAALKDAVKRGVAVYLLIDGYEGRRMSKHFMRELSESGIFFRLFNPVFTSRYFYFGRRLHQKVFVADAYYALVGGINVADHYNDVGGQRAWLDFALYIEGEASKDLCVLCWKTWNNYSPTGAFGACIPSVTPDQEERTGHCQLSMRRNDWVRRKNEISSTYIQMLRKSEKQVIILCSYFLPGRIIRRQLNYAVGRGVNIKIITAGSSDVVVAKNAEKYMYDWLLRRNIELYEYQPAVLHGKIAVADHSVVTVGSYNVNNISAYASIELNMNVYDDKFGKKAEDMLLHLIQHDCMRITRENHEQAKTLYKRFVRLISYEFIRVIFYLFTFYFKRKD
jgi:cardiolipin synthase